MTLSPDGSPLPVALYSCANCFEDRSFHADDLFWVHERRGWFCEWCIDDIEGSLTIGDRLDKWMEKQGATV